MEFGARALGNRSILADSSRPNVVRVINDMIKMRDFWMPFAPVARAKQSEVYMRKPKPMPAPYMIITFDVRSEKRQEMQAALHPYDWTARPQEISRAWNPDYWRILERFEALTGRGCVELGQMSSNCGIITLLPQKGGQNHGCTSRRSPGGQERAANDAARARTVPALTYRS
jgi:hypothetical protein